MKFLICLSIILFSLSGYSWGPTGHRTVAEIAQRNLEPEVLKTVKKILSGQDLADVANWADEIKGDSQYASWSQLHFADISATYKDYQDAPPTPGGDVVVSIMALTDFLKTQNANAFVKVSALAHVDQVQALKLLVHFVGDVHQPLHVGDPADLGGNTVKVNWMGKWTSNLHSLWDNELIDETERMSYSDYAGFLERVYGSNRQAWSSGNAISWANESMALRPGIYVFPDKQTPGTPTYIYYDYVDESRDVLRTRLYQGGIRLAVLLNSIFGQHNGSGLLLREAHPSSIVATSFFSQLFPLGIF